MGKSGTNAPPPFKHFDWAHSFMTALLRHSRHFFSYEGYENVLVYINILSEITEAWLAYC